MGSIFSYWHQGSAAAPEVVKLCFNSLERSSGDWSLQLLSEDSVAQYIDDLGLPPAVLERLSLAHRSDLLRTQLLIRYGGIWADATVFSNQDFSSWVPPLLEPAGLFMFHRPGPDREISNWFIAAEAQHPILLKLNERLLDFWSATTFRTYGRDYTQLDRLLFRAINRNRWAPRFWTWAPVRRALRVFPYMIYHYLFYDLVSSDRRMKALWAKVPKLSADGPHALLRAGLLSPAGPAARQLIDAPVSPVYKLKWRLGSEAIPEDSVLGLLRSSAKAGVV